MLKEGDFIEVEYVAKIKGTEIIFDLTDEKLAREKNIFSPNLKYGPLVICLGQKHILIGLDKKIIGKDVGEFAISLSAEEAFGKRDPKLIRIYPTSVFKEKNINPRPGLQLNLDGRIGLIRTVTGGRTYIDFNHPLSGKEILYEIKINRVVKDTKEKLDSLLRILLLLKEPNAKIDKETAEIILKEKLPNELESALKDKIKELISEIKEVKIIIENK